MKMSNNIVLITGGGSGIGFETARLFSEKGNQVIITGRNWNKLQDAAGRLKNARAIACDITNEQEVDELVRRINQDFGNLNILMNNAGKAYAYALSENAGAFDKAHEEMFTNYLSTIRLTEKLLPLLKKNEEAAIINNTSVTAFIPGVAVPTYSASKAALHSYTQSLRQVLQQTSAIKVFEVMAPLVDTAFSKALAGTKIAPAIVAESILEGLGANIYEIHVASTADLYAQYLSSPQQAFRIMNRIKYA